MVKRHFETVGNCSAFVEIGSDVACSVDEMHTLLTSLTTPPSSQPYQFDHVFPGVVQDGIPLVVLYAEIGSKTFAAFHDVLADLAAQQKVKYILRHYILVSYYRKYIPNVICHWCMFY